MKEEGGEAEGEVSYSVSSDLQVPYDFPKNFILNNNLNFSEVNRGGKKRRGRGGRES